MRAVRLGIGVPSAPAAGVLHLAERSEAWGIDRLWVGSPQGNDDDTYTIVTAAAVAAVRPDLRIGVYITVRNSSEPLRIAEDIGVLDSISGGRLSVAFTRPSDGDEGWSSDVRRILEAPDGWPLPDGRSIPVTPAPVQSVLPAYTVEPKPGGFVLVPYPGRAAGSSLGVSWRRAVRIPTGREIVELRRRANAARASELVLSFGREFSNDLDVLLGEMVRVLRPGLRCPSEEIELLTVDAARWVRDCQELHEYPGPTTRRSPEEVGWTQNR